MREHAADQMQETPVKITLDDPENAPRPAGPYSQVARIDLGGDAGVLLFVSGQIALGADGEVAGGADMAEQSRLVFEGLGALLAAHGAGFGDIVNIRSFLTDLSRLPEYGAVRRRFLPDPPPTSTTVEVSRLFRPGALLEVDVVAAIPAR